MRSLFGSPLVASRYEPGGGGAAQGSPISGPAVASSTDRQSVELGVRFRPDRDGFVTGLRYYRGPSNPGPHVGSLWLIEEGVKQGEKVIVEGLQKVRDGMEVKATVVPAETAATPQQQAPAASNAAPSR